MRSVGVVRKLDDLGRLVLPKELRRTLDLEGHAALEIFTDGEAIMLRKYTPGCVFCGQLQNLQTLGGKRVCVRCRSELMK